MQSGLLTFKTVAIGCSLFLGGFVFQEPLSQMQRSTFLPLATLIFNLFGGLGLKVLTLHFSSGSPEYPTLMPPPVEGDVRNHPRSK